MTGPVLTLVHAISLLLFGVFMSALFAGIPFTRKSTVTNLIFSLSCLAAQGCLHFLGGEAFVWKLYPLVTHLPLLLLLVLFFKRPFITALVSVFTSYLCCQPAKWFGVLTHALFQNFILEYAVRITVLAGVFTVSAIFFARPLSKAFSGDTKSVYVFAVVPTVYYIFDYATVVYTDIWIKNNEIVLEFLPFFISIMFMIFCLVYYREYEKKFDAERNEEIIRITVEQQAKELESIKRSEHEIRVLRHDLRLFLSALAVCIETDEKSVVQGMIKSYSEHVDGTKIKRFCTNDTINYVLSDFEGKCEANKAKFVYRIKIGEVNVNEILFSSILSNALDNALHAVSELPEENRTVTLMLREAEGKLLLSVKNPVLNAPTFVNGLPISRKKGHGYGTQSIRYLTEKLGGNSQFTVKDSVFVTRVII